jgi:hypothetical protein
MSDVTRTIAAAARFIPETWAQRALSIFRSNIVLTKQCMKHTDYTPAFKGQTLHIPYPGTMTAADKSEDGTASVSVPSGGTGVDVSLSYLSYVDFICEDWAAAQADPSGQLMDRWLTPAMVALANRIEDKLFALVTGFTNNVGTLGTALVLGTGTTGIRGIKKKLDDSEVPAAGRFLVIGTEDEVALKADSNLTNFFQWGTDPALKNGGLTRLEGMDLYLSTRLPAIGGTPSGHASYAGTPEGLILVSAPNAGIPDGSGVKVAQVTDPASGLSLRVLYQYNMDYRGVRVGMDILYGVSILKNLAGVYVKTK